MTFVHVLAGLALVLGTCAAIAAAATLGMVGMARLERSAVRAEPRRRATRRRPLRQRWADGDALADRRISGTPGCTADRR